MSFINDVINLTQGQLLIKYWYVWITVVIIFFLLLKFNNKK